MVSTRVKWPKASHVDKADVLALRLQGIGHAASFGLPVVSRFSGASEEALPKLL